MIKKILITGSTDGFGKLAATTLASKGHTVYLHGRSPEKLQTAIEDVKTGSRNNEVYGFLADFSNLDEVKQMAKAVNKELNQLDVLINNAGVFKSPTNQSKQGFEICYTVNYFAPFFLTKELMPLIEKTEASRVINLSSAAQSEISFDVAMGKQVVNTNTAYAQSKLALTMWSFYLAKQTKNTTVIAVNPGSLLNTKMALEAYGQYWSQAGKGSDILVELALNDEHKEHNGEYFDNDSGFYSQAHPIAYQQEAIDDLIRFTKKIID